MYKNWHKIVLALILGTTKIAAFLSHYSTHALLCLKILKFFCNLNCYSGIVRFELKQTRWQWIGFILMMKQEIIEKENTLHNIFKEILIVSWWNECKEKWETYCFYLVKAVGILIILAAFLETLHFSELNFFTQKLFLYLLELIAFLYIFFTTFVHFLLNIKIYSDGSHNLISEKTTLIFTYSIYWYFIPVGIIGNK